MTKKSYLKAIFAYLVTALLSLTILTLVMRLWKADLSVPFNFRMDSVYSSALVKGVIDNGWYLHNKFIGAPFGQDYQDFDSVRPFLYLMTKWLGMFAADFGKTVNYFYIVTFPLTAVAALFVFRRFKISYPTAVLGGLLYAFLPYHFFRGVDHLYLSAYFTVPLASLIALWIMTGEKLLFKNGGQFLYSFSLDKKTAAAVFICLLLSASGVYYSLFGAFFIVVAAIYSYLITGDRLRIFVAAGLIVILLGGIVVAGLPKFIYQRTNGVNHEIARRKPAESEIYGLRLSQLILPVTGHRLPALAEVKKKYNRERAMDEADFSTLGLIPAVGFMLLIGVLLFPLKKSEPETNGLLRPLSVLNAAAVLLGTVGGFSALFAYLLSPQIRGYNRVSVYIAFFSLMGAVVIIDRYRERLSVSVAGRFFSYSLIGVLLIIGVLDQTTNDFVPDYQSTKKQFREQEEFVRIIESRLPERSMIFQLPYIPFPENPPVEKMTDYDHFASGYLHSKTLRWSYGAIRGRYADLWQREVTSRPVDEFVEIIALAGFDGLIIDRRGFEDGGAKIENEIDKIVKSKPVVSANGRLIFYELGEFLEAYRAGLSKQEFGRAAAEAKFPVSLRAIAPRRTSR